MLIRYTKLVSMVNISILLKALLYLNTQRSDSAQILLYLYLLTEKGFLFLCLECILVYYL